MPPVNYVLLLNADDGHPVNYVLLLNADDGHPVNNVLLLNADDGNSGGGHTSHIKLATH